MVTNLESYKRSKQDYNNYIKGDSDAFDSYMRTMYKMEITPEIRKSYVEEFDDNKFDGEDYINIDRDKVLEYFYNNPIGLYVHCQNRIEQLKQTHLQFGEFTDSNILNYNRTVSKYRDMVEEITTDYLTKFENGYFNIKEN